MGTKVGKEVGARVGAAVITTPHTSQLFGQHVCMSAIYCVQYTLALPAHVNPPQVGRNCRHLSLSWHVGVSVGALVGLGMSAEELLEAVHI